ncbi:hypothetical protein GCM10009850_026110 [Nonomuraea monospora]|uniref:Transposase n=1 Tax=Nonomuraea monospora TaxID=568818 RepID=A0ABN3CCQ9_9ACTN
MRDLPARVVVYLLLAGCLFPEPEWRRLTAGLAGPKLAQFHHRPAHRPRPATISMDILITDQ